MNQSLLSEFGDPIARVEAALAALRAGQGVLVADDEDRENEGDLIFAAESMTNEQMAMMIRECSGIVCLCLTDERVRQLELPMMVEANSSHYQTAFTVTIEAADDLMQLAGLKPYGVLCELTKEDGSMARLPDLVAFGRQHRMPVLTIEDLVQYRQLLSERSA